MKKVLFVNDEMVVGGVARILNTLLKQLEGKGYEVDLLVLHKHGDLLKEVPEYVNIIDSSPFFDVVDLHISEIKDFRLKLKKMMLIFYMKTGLIKSKIKKERQKILEKQYDIEFSAKEGFCSVFTAVGDSKRKLNWIQTDYKVQNFSKNHMGLMKDILKDIDVNIACSNVANQSYSEVFEVDNVVTLHNLMNTERIYSIVDQPIDDVTFKDQLNLITVARFHPQKALHRMINACKTLKEEYIDFHLYIIGGGELESELREQVQVLGLEQEISFLGYKSNPYKYMKKADLYLLSSMYEGFPTIVLESLICSTPVLTTKVAGVDEQLVKEHYGWICENTDEAFTNTLLDVINSQTYLKYKEQLKDYQYYNDKIINKMISYFEGDEDEK